jgi:arginyl-tRNA synthetase
MYSLEKAKKEVEESIKKTLKELNYECEIKLEIPPTELGDFAFACFSLAPIAKKSPNQISKDLFSKIKKTSWIERIEEKNGYLNFFLNEEKLKKETLKEIFEKEEKYGFLEQKNKKVIVEHTSANPNGPLHVGRARNPIIGDTIVRISKAAGYNVESQFYLDDMGKQVAVLAWGVNNIDKKEIPAPDYDKPDHKIVGYYQVASKIMQEDEKVRDQIGDIVRKSEEGDLKTIEMVHKAYTPVLEGINESMSRINITIDSYIPESNFLKDKSVDEIINKLKKTKYSGEEDSAYFLDMQPFGIKGRNTKFFYQRRDGTTLYATRDIAYHLWKIKNADILINVLGEDHKLESKQVEIALKLLNAKKIPNVIFYSFVSMPGGKMSTRKGRVVFLDDLVEQCIKNAYKEVEKRRGKELSEKQMKKISEIIGTGAVRYNIIKVQPEKDIVFKWEEALNFEGNSAPFIQYAHARACSILRKNKEEIKKIDTTFLKHTSEYYLIKKLAEFPIIVDEAYRGFKPHLIASYVFEVASLFNQFYRDCTVLHEEDITLRHTRLKLVEATKIILKNGLNLLGIQAPGEM